MDALHGGLGLVYMIDAAGEGTLITQQLGLNYAYHAKLTEKASFRIGLNIAGFKRSLDWSRLTFGDQIDTRYGFIYETQQEIGLSRIYGLNFKFGTALVHRNYMISYAAHNLNQPNHSMLPGITSRWPLRHFVHAAYCLELNDKSGIIYDAIAQKQNQFNYLLLKANYYYKFLRIGTGVNLNKRILGMIGAQLRNFRLSYIYSRDESILTQNIFSSHEVQFTWSLQTTKGKDRECPLVIWNGF
jgi:type IX secretion system PorP/SprF family membrane protein